MPRLQRERSKSGYYHIMVRGNERKNIFHDDEDKLRLIEIIYEKQKISKFLLHAFCLMDNHIHLMLSEGEEDVGRVMKRINTSYVYYFNKKYKRVGHLFQDRFKSEIVEDEPYILALARYIHQNPVKAGIARTLEEYKWSSYSSFLKEDDYFRKIVYTEMILGLFSKDIKEGKTKFEVYMKEKAHEEFADLEERVDEMDEETAKELYKNMFLEWARENKNEAKIQLPDNLIKEFREKTKLSIRRIAEIAGINKDKISKILRN